MIGDAAWSMSAGAGLNWELFKCRGLSIRPIGIGGYIVTAVKIFVKRSVIPECINWGSSIFNFYKLDSRLPPRE